MASLLSSDRGLSIDQPQFRRGRKDRHQQRLLQLRKNFRNRSRNIDFARWRRVFTVLSGSDVFRTIIGSDSPSSMCMLITSRYLLGRELRMARTRREFSTFTISPKG